MNRTENQKTVNLLENTRNQLSRFRRKKWVKIADDRNGVYRRLKALNLKLQW